VAQSQPYTVACDGGLVKSANSIDLLRTPGVARELRNFEVSTEGGYRRINGFAKYGGGSAVQPTGGTATILGVFPYADGVIVTVGTNIYFSNTGTSWLQINRSSVSGSGDNHTAFTGRSVLARTGQGQCQFVLFEGPDYDYGEVIIADGANKLYSFRMEGTGALTTRTFFAEEITVTGTKHVKYITIHDHHLIAAGVEDNLSTVFYSVYNDPNNFTGTGAGSVTISDQVEGIKGFREDLIVFAENSIHKLVNINDSSNIRIDPITENVGCLSGYSIQEIGGDLIFLAPDGLRTVAGTARIGDVELGTVSKEIQPLVTDLTESINSYIITSLVLREKSQYRLFYTDTSKTKSEQRGIIGTLRPNGFQWSETRGIEVTEIGSGFDQNGVENYYHGDTDGYVYVHDSGNDFDGSNILARYATPDYDYGDLGTLKTLHYLKLSASAEGVVQPDVQVRFDYGSTDIPQPPDLFDLGVIDPPSIFGEALFNTNVFGGAQNPLIRVALQGSGHSNNFTIISEDTKAPYTINGLYINYVPSGRR
tara:strand:+ start:186 stop:1793 length:1608 start_codon:yes stop_codon:yes gene_type:complete